MAIITVDAFQCDKCQHIWFSHIYNTTDNLPIACGKCKTPYWNRGKKKE